MSAFQGQITVGCESAIGPRRENQDRAVARVSDGGSWLVAVADGMGGQPRGAEAAQAAVDALPSSAAGPGEMRAAFEAAAQAVGLLAPEHLRYSFSSTHLCPAAVLCVASGDASGRCTVAYAGDTMPAVLWHGPDGWTGTDLGYPHRYSNGTISRFLGGPGPAATRASEEYLSLHEIEAPDVECDRIAVVIASDGAWEPLVYRKLEKGADPEDSPFAAAMAECLASGVGTAEGAVAAIMASAAAVGVDDNVSCAAVMCTIG